MLSSSLKPNNNNLMFPIIFVDEILYNLQLLFIISNEHKNISDPIFKAINEININKINNNTVYSYNNYNYYIKDNIEYLNINSNTYFIKENIYFKFKNNDTTIKYFDKYKTFVFFNDLFIENSKIIKLLNSISNIINDISGIYKKQIILEDNYIYIKNKNQITIKIINLSYFYYTDKNKVYLKEFYIILSDINNINVFLNNILSLINYFMSIKNI